MPKNTLPRSRRAAAPKKNTKTKSAPAKADYVQASDAASFAPLQEPIGAKESTAGAHEIDRREKGWETATPEISYRLECFSPNDLEQKIVLTRAEYIALKEQLVRIRGFAAAEEGAHA